MLAEPQHPTRVEQPDTSVEALIREARRRTRRRRARRLSTLVALGAVALGLYTIMGGGSGAVITETATRPYVNLHAFEGHGELVFVSRGRVWALDGSRRTLRRLPTPYGYTPSSPTLSHDGRWMAYRVTRNRSPYGPYELWVAHADGTGAHVVRGLKVNELVGWSPTADVIAVEAGETSYPNGSPVSVDLVSATDGHVRVVFKRSGKESILKHGAIWSTVWSPDGSSLAVSTYSPERYSGTEILAVPAAAGAQPTVWFSIRNTQHLKGALSCGQHCGDDSAIAQLAGWWPKRGIGLWIFSSGMTHNNDSTPLAIISRPHARPRLVSHTLSDGTTDAVAASSQGRIAVVASSNSAGREYAVGKTVQECSASPASCITLAGANVWTGRPLPCNPCFGAPATGPGSAVSLDPAWSANGTLLAYVKAPAYRAAAGPNLAWYRTHRLYIWNTLTNTTRQLGAINGSSLPTWSHSSTSLPYVSGDGLWLANTTTGNTLEIEHPLYSVSAWHSLPNDELAYYGQIPWSQQFSWHSG